VEPLIVNSEPALQSAIGELRSAWISHRYLTVTWRTGMKRSADQNAISHVWYEQMGRELREESTQGWRRYCKLHHGVPILRAEDAEFRRFYDRALKVLDYPEKLEAMDFVPVTSLMTKPQLSAYLEAVQADFKKRGVALEFPEHADARPAR
jgi:hypothetical protein